jgi:hypothetical protein
MLFLINKKLFFVHYVSVQHHFFHYHVQHNFFHYHVQHHFFHYHVQHLYLINAIIQVERHIYLWKSNSACWSSTKQTSSLTHRNITCSQHDRVEKVTYLALNTTFYHFHCVVLCLFDFSQQYLTCLCWTLLKVYKKRIMSEWFGFWPNLVHT